METKKFIDGIETKIYKGKENKMIKTVGDLRKILNNLDDDYK